MEKSPILPPFKRFCVTIGNLPSSYVDSMSYYECIMWLCKYLKDTVVPTVNENAEAVNELINWFNNLDVQEEINNKLDKMAESGELEEIIASYLQSNAVISYNTLTNLVASEDLVAGMTVRTLGHTTYLDGLGRLYKIRNITNEDVVDGVNIVAITNSETLIAELIPDNTITRLNRITDRKFLFLGDSYGVHTSARGKTWIEFVIENLGLVEDENAFISSEGSVGFLGDPNFQNKTFLVRLQEAYNSIDNPNEITDIIIGGGVNDCTYSSSQITTAIRTFMTNAQTMFPNAKVSLGFISWSSDYSQLDAFTTVIQSYQNIRDYNGAYIEGSEFCWHYNGWLFDTVHPVEDASRVIAQCINNYIKCGTGSLAHGQVASANFTAETGFTVSSPMLYTEQKGNIIEGVFRLTVGHTGYSYTFNNTWFKVATFNRAWLTGGSRNIIKVKAFVVDTSNHIYTMYLDVKLQSNGVYIRGYDKVNDNSGTDLALTIKTIQIIETPFTISAVGN